MNDFIDWTKKDILYVFFFSIEKKDRKLTFSKKYRQFC